MDVAERCPSWPKEHDWKSCVVKSHREFESPPLRQIFQGVTIFFVAPFSLAEFVSLVISLVISLVELLSALFFNDFCPS